MAHPGFSYKELPLTHIRPSSNHQRESNGDLERSRLFLSIRELGILDAIAVCEERRHEYTIIDGHRRYQIAERLSFKTVPCYVYARIALGERERLRFELQTNVLELSPLERSRVIVHADVLRLLEKHGYKEEGADELVKMFPVTFGVTREGGGGKRWCFSLPDTAWQSHHILAIGVRGALRDPIDRVFVLPTKIFAPAGTCTLTVSDDAPSQYAIKEADRAGALEVLIEDTVERERQAEVLAVRAAGVFGGTYADARPCQQHPLECGG